jgi:3-deoxy-manno-octulosonate cytidylyltransferase (CMP-KDO synthetase)
MSLPSLAVIPARLASSRLPRKPLQPLAGRPLLEWVWRRALATELFDAVVVATDSDEVAGAAAAFGARVVLTDVGHVSGTDRIAEVVERPEFAGYEAIVNVQGDEPFVGEAQLLPALRAVRDEGWPIATVATDLAGTGELYDPAVVKVVRNAEGGALFFSRAAIPHLRDREPGAEDFAAGLFLRHLGVYAYRRDALRRWVALPEGVLERAERLEQLRPLAAGMRIAVRHVPACPAGVDTPDDVLRAEALLRAEAFSYSDSTVA